MKRILSLLLLALGMVFILFFFEKDFGYKEANGSDCLFLAGYSAVYVHWFKPLNNTTYTFCDYEVSPPAYEGKYLEEFRCDCDKR